MNPNKTKRKLAVGSYVLGSFLCLNSSAVTEVMARCGFDYLIVDMEHGLMSLDTASDMIMAMNSQNVTPIIRVEKNDEAIINRALGAGAYGIMIPMINTPQEAEKAVKACKYPLEGVRGVGPGHMSLYGLEMKKYQENANREIMTILQIEHIDAVNRINEIIEVPGIDVIFIGPSDLASSMDLIGQNEHQLVQEAISKVVKSCKEKNVCLGIYSYSAETAIARLQQGFRLITYALDSRFLSIGAEQALSSIHGHFNCPTMQTTNNTGY